jgi:hypothetical protein
MLMTKCMCDSVRGGRCAYLMSLAMLLPAVAGLRVLPTQHRAQPTSRSSLAVVLVGWGETDPVRVERDRRTVFGPEAVETWEDGRGTGAAVVEIAAAAVAAGCGGLDSGSEDALKCGRSRCEAAVVGPWCARWLLM